MFEYKLKPLAYRVLESNKIKQRYPDKVPVIIARAENIRTDIPLIEKNKYLVARTFSFGQFLFIIRRQLNLSPDKALFIFINNKFIPASTLMGDIYNEHADTDGFLYASYSGESVFGY